AKAQVMMVNSSTLRLVDHFTPDAPGWKPAHLATDLLMMRRRANELKMRRPFTLLLAPLWSARLDEDYIINPTAGPVMKLRRRLENISDVISVKVQAGLPGWTVLLKAAPE